jgi:putative addiction module killer protein
MGWSAISRNLLLYADSRGNEPFTQWLRGLRDDRTMRRIHARLRRLEQGNFGDCKHLKAGVFELRLFFGPGFRVYFGITAGQIIVLLCAGDKSSQRRDIETALTYWMDYTKS